MTPKKKNIRIKKTETHEHSTQIIPSVSVHQKHKIYFSIIFFLAAFLIYSNTLNHGYVLDDHLVIVQNASVKKGLAGIPEIFTHTYLYGYDGGKNPGTFRPLSLAMFALEWEFFPGQPFIGHLINVILYSFTTVLVYFLALKLCGANLVMSFSVAVLFLIHPIHTEVVANIKSRDEILSLLFVCGSLLATINYALSGKIFLLLTSLLLFFLALLSKENAAVLPAVVPLFLVYFSKFKLKQTGFVTALFAGVLAAYILLRFLVPGGWEFRTVIPESDNMLVAANGITERSATILYIFLLYFKLMLLPYPLISDYSIRHLQLVDYTSLLPFAGLALFAILAYYVIRNFKHKSIGVFGIVFFFLSLLPVSNIFFTGGAAMAERFLYMPSLGFCFWLSSLMQRFISVDSNSSFNIQSSLLKVFRKNYLYTTVLLVICLSFGYLTVSRSTQWSDNRILFSSDLRHAPESAKLNYGYATELLQEIEESESFSPVEKNKRIEEAIEKLQHAINIYPSFLEAHEELGHAILLQGDFRKADEHFKRTASMGSENPGMYNNYGLALLESGKIDSAILIFNKSLSIKQNMEAYNNLGAAYFRMGNYLEAKNHYSKSLELKPNDFTALKNLGSAYGSLNLYDSALYYFNKAYVINPGDPELNRYIGITYRFKGDEKSAVQFLDKVNSINEQAK